MDVPVVMLLSLGEEWISGPRIPWVSPCDTAYTTDPCHTRRAVGVRLKARFPNRATLMRFMVPRCLPSQIFPGRIFPVEGQALPTSSLEAPAAEGPDDRPLA